MTLKIAALPPMPNARVSTATAVKPGVFSNWRKANLRSFIAQRLHRIDPGRATGRLQTGKDGDCSQNHHYAREGDTGEAACWGGPEDKNSSPRIDPQKCRWYVQPDSLRSELASETA